MFTAVPIPQSVLKTYDIVFLPKPELSAEMMQLVICSPKFCHSDGNHYALADPRFHLHVKTVPKRSEHDST